jgi:hypothetical protein
MIGKVGVYNLILNAHEKVIYLYHAVREMCSTVIICPGENYILYR